MTKEKLKAYIQKDIRNLEKEQRTEVSRRRETYKKETKRTDQTTHLLSYLITRKKTLQEILNLL